MSNEQYLVTTSFGLRLVVPKHEFFFYHLINKMYFANLINAATLYTAESIMVWDGPPLVA